MPMTEIKTTPKKIMRYWNDSVCNVYGANLHPRYYTLLLTQFMPPAAVSSMADGLFIRREFRRQKKQVQFSSAYS